MNIDWSKIEIDERFRGEAEIIVKQGKCKESSPCCEDCPFFPINGTIDCSFKSEMVKHATEYIRRLDNAKIDTVPISLKQLNHICNGYVDLCKLEDDMADTLFDLSESLDIKFDESKDEYLKRRKADLVERFFNRLKEVNGG